ncbi:Na+/H+ antiporter subunit A [Gulosibacter faecalis]|jgi:multicomponent Na+:H+ antiporter subunit A|uniref:Na+/H+ antiporter subunit A n=1 Tax=Gulosibacter faecalis TaxID=272240 RepID=A0ABW5V417_9MICO|nr:Na+/H+ antiporter subunit A [Gulosibacter faecalis]
MAFLLALFAVASLAMPALRRLPGTSLFYIGAAVSAAAAVWTASLAPQIFAGETWRVSYEWLPTLSMNLDFRIDALSWVLAMIVTAIGALVLLYCASYFTKDEPGLGRFAGVLLGFAGVMFGLVTTDNIYLMFVFWEATSILSYLLIGHYTGRRPSRGAAMQALLVTTFGGLAMLVGIVMLHVGAGSALFSEILTADIPHDGFLTTALVLVIVGAVTKSAQLPFHFWLPGAMAAPTPVSAYLHAASMVKAGVYLVLRLVPAFAEVPGFRETLIVLGVWTMLVGGWRSLRQFDLKLILAYGTVSQLGFMMTIAGFGGRDAMLAAIAMVIGHALFKAALFLIVGIIDHQLGTRDIRKISGLGRRMPVLTVTAIIAAASMAGIPPLWGFVAKEAVFSSFLTGVALGDSWSWVALIGTAVGSMLTVAYTCRFLWGAFASKPGIEPGEKAGRHAEDLIAPILLVVTTIVIPFFATPIDHLIAQSADTAPMLDPEHPYHLAIWHGLEPALGISAITLLTGLGLFAARRKVERVQSFVPDLFEAARGYWLSLRVLDTVAARVTSSTQRGSLPFYLAIIFIVTVAAVVVPLPFIDYSQLDLDYSFSWVQLGIVVVLIMASIAVTQSTRRFQGVILVSATGYAIAVMFALHGAPDLATTQALIETMSLIVFVLVLRRLPAKHAHIENNLPAWLRWVIAISVALAIGVITAIAMGFRIAPSDGLSFPELAVEGGHGYNVVNVTLVDLRGWDTMGELSVLIAAATGVASLVYLSARGSQREAAARPDVRQRSRRFFSNFVKGAQSVEGKAPLRRSDDHRPWLIAGNSLAPEHRSIVVEVVVRIIFHALFIASLYLLFAGHNDPGGGFAGGVIAGLALSARYLAGGREELDAAVRIDAGRLLGIGMVLAAGSAIVPIFFGYPPLTSFWVDSEVSGIGHIVFVTSTIFDIGVYLIVIGLVIDILRSLGSELDVQAEEEHLGARNVGAVVIDGAEVRGTVPTPKPMTGSIPVVRRRSERSDS